LDATVSGSFRDPSGFVFTRDGILYRQVNRVFAEQFELLLSSGLYEALTREGLLVRHEEADPSLAATPEAYKVLKPERVGFISYPYEWSFSQLKDAALATLRIQGIALEHGMSLRDATAYNVQFEAGRPVFIDTLSFERLREGEPWVAYGQFCRHFLAPLALMRYRDVRLGQLARVHIDGVPLDLAAELLPVRARLRLALLLHLFLHARSQRRHAGEATAAGRTDQPKRKSRPFSLQAFRGLIETLESAIRKLRWEPRKSVWSAYYDEARSYTEAALDVKKSLVAEFVEAARPRTVWDLGANTGPFSRIAAAKGARTVSFDVDPATVEINYQAVVSEKESNVLPLVMDLANPSPGVGWANSERMCLSERAPADMALALALVHHLAIANNVPLEDVAAFLWDVCTWLAIEFVPKSDPMVQVLLASREDVFSDYTLEGFERAFSERFEILRREAIAGSERVMYLMRGR
jgi:ribosomal protein L11 methylase PrmA